MRHKKSILLATALVAVSAVLVTFTPGCTGPAATSSTGGYQDPHFPEEYTRLHELATYNQATSGARADATLYDMHFYGDKLNSLGEDKLSLMLDDDDDRRPMVVYINAAGSDDDFVARQESTRAFALAHGVASDDLRFERGPNPGSKTLAAPLLRNIGRTDSTPSAAQGNGMDAPVESNR